MKNQKKKKQEVKKAEDTIKYFYEMLLKDQEENHGKSSME